MGIRDRPTSPLSPWQNGYAERLIGSIRRDCIDHVIVFAECHLRHLLRSYLNYYNETRTHLSLDKDAPISRANEAVGPIFGRPVLRGLHHQYVRIKFAIGTGGSIHPVLGASQVRQLSVGDNHRLLRHKTPRALRQHNAILTKQPSDVVDERGARVSNALPCAMH
jgi:hypothetical protein